jgi:hypothetical protein
MFSISQISFVQNPPLPTNTDEKYLQLLEKPKRGLRELLQAF